MKSLQSRKDRNMEPWSARDDRPYFRPDRRNRAWPAIALSLAVIACLIAAYSYYARNELPAAPPMAAAPQPAPALDAQSPAAPAAPIRLPEQQAQPALPTLENSDALARDSLVGLIGRQAFEERVLPDELVRRIVATVDNLPRPTAARHKMPLERVPGEFRVSGGGERMLIDGANFARYTPLVRVLESVNAQALVAAYVRAYPLFQRAYEELGYPGQYFNDRLLEALDDMLAAPQLDAPVELARPRVLYEFADPALERRSAGQKILLRIGPDNAARVKAKLREIRAKILAAGAPGPRG
jgi:hypothetical protein